MFINEVWILGIIEISFVTDYENKRIPAWMVEEYHLQNDDKVKVTQKIKQKKNKLLWQIVDIKKLETE